MEDDYTDNQSTPYEDLLQQIADEHGVDMELLRRLIGYEAARSHLERRPGAREAIRRMIEDWLGRSIT